MKQMKQWEGFTDGTWTSEINVRDFIQKNVLPYKGDASFLMGSTEKTDKLMAKVTDLFRREQENGGVLDIDTETVSSLTAYQPGYIDRENELIVGFQTGAPLKRGVNPFGGINMARKACKAYGHALSDKIEQEFQYRTTHNDGVFRVYTDEMKRVRRAGVLTGLPDAYGRGRIIGDYRRVALYGVDALIKAKEEDKKALGEEGFDVDSIRASEEIYQQIQFLNKMKEMAASYDYDISEPAADTREAIQWIYFAYLASIKEQNGAAMSLGRVNGFLDIYIERDIKKGTLEEATAQELIDQFVMKLRMARHLRTPEYNELFGGDPMWITESLGGMSETGGSLVTKNTFRFLQTLYNLGPAPEPNLTVLWSKDLPKGFKEFCAQVSIDTDSIQYENDDIMRPDYGDDYGIACCVSAMKLGKQMQFFGARCNLPKLLLLAINGGYDTTTQMQVGPKGNVLKDDILDYDTVMDCIHIYRKWICKLYINTLNVIHYMHDKYAYEKTQMALHDTDVQRLMACGVAGLSVLTDSLSAIKHAQVKAVRDEQGYITDFETVGTFPKYGNDDDRADQIAVQFIHEMSEELKSHKTYRDAVHTLSVLTITSNVMYGKKTNNTPDGRRAGEPFAPGGNPMHNREEEGALASLNSVAKLSYDDCKDGVSNTFSITPQTLGHDKKTRVSNLVQILDGYFEKKAQHINVNVLNPKMLQEAYDDPSKYPNLTIRVSGYAVNFHKLSKDQQREVLMRTFHEAM